MVVIKVHSFMHVGKLMEHDIRTDYNQNGLNLAKKYFNINTLETSQIYFKKNKC